MARIVGYAGGAFLNVNQGSGSDTTPEPWSFPPRGNMPLSTAIESNAIIVAGIDAPAPWSVADGLEASINGGAYSTAGGNVNAGDSVKVRIDSSASYLTAVTGSLTIGGVTVTFTVTTLAEAGAGGPFAPLRHGGVCPRPGASRREWALYYSRQRTRAARAAAQGG